MACPTTRHPQFDETLVAERGYEEGEALSHPLGTIGVGLCGRDRNLGKRLPPVQPLPDKAAEIVEADLGVRHEPSEGIEGASETPCLRFGPLHDDPPVPIGPPLAKPMGHAIHDRAVDDLAHERDRCSGSHTRRTKSRG